MWETEKGNDKVLGEEGIDKREIELYNREMMISVVE